MGLREFGKIFALAVSFIYAGNAIGAPIWGVLGTSGNTKIGMYVAPVLLALFVIGCTIAVRRGKAQYTRAGGDFFSLFSSASVRKAGRTAPMSFTALRCSFFCIGRV